MLRRTVIAIAALILTGQFAAGQDTIRHDGVIPFLESISLQHPDSIIAKVDALVVSGADAGQQADIAGLSYDYFTTSPIMGHDGVAVHIADRWFLSGALKWPDPDTWPALYAYAEFNRQSLIGCQAPELDMESLRGGRLSVRKDAGHFKLLYFYDPQCSTCRRYSERLAALAKSYSGGRFSIFAVNTGSDRAQWERYVSEKFSDIATWKVDFHNLWDPEDANDYHRKYGVLSTPVMVLIDAQNRIIGRQLDPDALEALLGVENKSVKGYKRLFNQLLTALAPVDTIDIAQIGASLSARTAGDSTIYRETFYELFNYLRDNPNYAYQCGAAAIARQYIVGRPEYWSEEYLGKVRHALDVFSMNPLGSVAPDLKLKDARGRGRRMLSGCSKYRLLIFHIVNCPDCSREFKVLDREAASLRKKGVKVVCIYAGKDEALWKGFIPRHPSGWKYCSDLERLSGMGEKYDVEFVPKLYLLDRHNRIIARDIDAETLVSMDL